MSLSAMSYLTVKRQTAAGTPIKPTHPLRFKDGDLSYLQDMIENDPIQNNNWSALNIVEGKVNTAGSFNFDLDYNECVHMIAAACGGLSTTDISSASDDSVNRHTITVASTLPVLSIEQCKGDGADTSNNRQGYEILRAFDTKVNSFTLSASEGIVNMAVDLVPGGMFQRAKVLKNANSGSSVNITVDTTLGLTTADTVNIFDLTPQSETDAVAAVTPGVEFGTVQIGTLGNSYTVANRAKIELVPQTPSYGTAAEVASFVHCSFQFGDDLTDAASNGEENVEDWEFSFMNNLESRWSSARKTPSVVEPKRRKASLKYTRYFESVKERDEYLDRVKKACILTVTNQKIVSATDTNQAFYKMKVEMSDTRIKNRSMETGTDELFAESFEHTLFYDENDGRAVRVIIDNAKENTEYTA